MELVLFGLVHVEDLDVGALHADSQPVTRGTEAEGEDLRSEVVLLELTSFAEVPGSDCVVQASSPQLGAVGGDVDARGPVGVALELADEGLIVEVPNGYVAIAAAAEADLGVGADC